MVSTIASNLANGFLTLSGIHLHTMVKLQIQYSLFASAFIIIIIFGKNPTKEFFLKKLEETLKFNIFLCLIIWQVRLYSMTLCGQGLTHQQSVA
jgi:hypothetical protein